MFLVLSFIFVIINNLYFATSEKASSSKSHNSKMLQEYVGSLPETFIYKDILFFGKEGTFNQFDESGAIDVGNDDIWIATYPKSGTTWIKAIVLLIYLDGDISRMKGKELSDFFTHLESGNVAGIVCFHQKYFFFNYFYPRESQITS